MSGRGSSELPRRKWRTIRWARRVTQGLFLALFLLSIMATASLTGGQFEAASSAEVPYPVEGFHYLDPLLGAVMLLATGSIPGPMLFSLIVLGSALFVGRGFCGWICPLGTMNHLVAEVKPGSPAARAGLRPGQLILSVDREPVSDEASLREALVEAAESDVVLLRVRDARGTRYLVIERE